MPPGLTFDELHNPRDRGLYEFERQLKFVSPIPRPRSKLAFGLKDGSENSRNERSESGRYCVEKHWSGYPSDL